MKFLVSVFVFAISGVAVLPAQQSLQLTPMVNEIAIPNSVVSDNYLIGKGDLLGVTVYGEPELSGNLRVDDQGCIRMPYGNTEVPVAGKEVSAIRPALEQALIKDRLALHPRVEVWVEKVRSRPVVIMGAVRNPMTLEATHPITLLEALSKAGGTAELAGDTIVLQRSGQPDLTIAANALLKSKNPAIDPLLNGGEQIRVIPAGKIFVAGSVKLPGAFEINDGSQLSVLRALAMAHGWLPSARPDDAILIHEQDGKSVRRRVRLQKILKHKAPDVQMAASDILYIPDDAHKALAMSLLKGLGSAAVLGLGYAAAGAL